MYIECECLTHNDKYITEYAYRYDSEYWKILDVSRETLRGYCKTFGTFDIETSCIIPEKGKGKDPFSFMYRWQFYDGKTAVFGNTWKQVIELFDRISARCNGRKYVVYVHNLSYEHFFFKNFLNDNASVFATDKHSILKAIYKNIEFRCSYMLSNMSLAKFIENTSNAVHLKGVGDLDYKVLRTPNSKLKPKENGYLYNDVVGLHEAITFLLSSNKDNLKTIPLTSTGYVRRDCRNAMRKNKNNRRLFNELALSYEEYIEVKEAFRGGNTASCRFNTDCILKNVKSFDISSSYPYVLVTQLFPMSKFMHGKVKTAAELSEYNKKYCTIGRYKFYDVKLKPLVPIPYLPFSKCNKIHKGNTYKEYNGRILECEYCEITLTNIDYDIICSQYDFSAVLVDDFMFAHKGKLPDELIEQVLHYFELKSKLKNVPGKEYEYMKAKNKLNSIFGMMVTDILHDEFYLEDSEVISRFSTLTLENVEVYKRALVEKYYKSRNSFLAYQWGVFVTAYARQRLQQAIDLIGIDCVYCDTDSVKYVGEHEYVFEYLNKNVLEAAKKENDIISVSVNEKEYTLGLWDREHDYDEFKTLGAKKYSFVIDGNIGITVAGLNKKKGATELAKKGGLYYFRDGEIFKDSGRTAAYYNDEPIHTIYIKGEKIETASNIGIVDVPYTMGISGTMLEMIENALEYYADF